MLTGIAFTAPLAPKAAAQDAILSGPAAAVKPSGGGPPARRGVGKPGESAPPAKEGEKPDAAKAEEAGKKDGEKGDKSTPPKVVRRDGLDLPEGDPGELTAAVGDDGKVGFRFRNQGWVDLVGWLSDISAQPIDWQELPGDAVNLVSPDRLTVAETIDLVNRHLLARGYTMLALEGGITIVKTDAINPGMVHWVSTAELQRLPNHSFVRTMLDAGWLSAEKLAVELAPMLSGSGKLTALATTNRIEAMDAAVNLREVARLLAEERDVASRDALAPEFRLIHIPAEEAKRLLEEFLGVKKKESSPMGGDQMEMMRRMQQQQQQQQGGQPPAAKSEIEISIVANVRQNSVLVRAPIDRVAIAAEFIKRIDVPGGALKSLTDATSRVEVYRLVSLDPDKLIEIAQEMNVLEPTTRIRVDKENKAVIVSGAAADRFIIKSLIERLDGGKRRFEVLQLRRLDAAAVTESISFLMGENKEDDDSSSRRNRYSYYGYGGGGDEKKDEDKFRVAANTNSRQILLWANEIEMEEVRSLLIKLGELPPPGGSGQTVRVIEASATPETLEYLKKLKAQWQAMSPNELVLPSEDEFRDAAPKRKTEPKDQDGSDGESESAPNDSKQDKTEAVEDEPIVNRQDASGPPLDQYLNTAVMLTVEQGPTVESEDSPTAPVEIRLDERGNLVLSSSDTKALDKLENLMLDIKPPSRSYEVFKIKNTSVTLLTIDLEEYFKDPDEKKDDNSNSYYRWIFGGDTSSDKGPTGLAKGGKLRFLPNSDTGTIIVSGATGSQLQTIRELIELWDVAEPVNPKLSRFTKLVTIQYGRSEKIADTVKEAYRDLLSSNDKAFSGAGGNNPNGGGRGSSNRSEGSRLEDSDSGQSGGGSDFSFNGKLSIGVDELGNTLLVSAEGESLLELIVSMIDKLDRAAQPGGEIEIVRFSGNVSAETLRQAMSALGNTSMGEPTRSNRSSFSGMDRSSNQSSDRGSGRGRRSDRGGEQDRGSDRGNNQDRGGDRSGERGRGGDRSR